MSVAYPMHPDPSVGTISGIFAAIVALLVAIGHGIRWSVGWTERRLDKKAAELGAWEVQLRARDAQFEAKIEGRMDAMERENRGLRMAFQHVYVALHRHAPEDPALALAERILAQSIPLDPFTPPDMANKLDKMP